MWNLKKILCWPESSLSDELFARLFTKWLLENGIGLNQGHINKIKRRNHPYTFQYYNKIKMRHLLSFSCFGINVMSGCLFFSGYKFLFPLIRLYRLSTRCGVATRINLVLFNIKWTKLCNKRFCVERFFSFFQKVEWNALIIWRHKSEILTSSNPNILSARPLTHLFLTKYIT